MLLVNLTKSKRNMGYRFILLGLLFNFLLANFVDHGGGLYIDGQNARNTGMGGYSASYSAGSNPAILVFNSPTVYFSYKNKFSGLYSVATASYLFSQKFNNKTFPIYISIITRKVDDIPDTRNIISTDNSIDYSKITYFSQNEIGFIATSNIKLKKLVLGISFKPFYTKLAEFNSYGFSTDIGLISKHWSNMLQFGCRFENLVSINYWRNRSVENYIPSLIIGGQINSNLLLLGLDIEKSLFNNSLLKYYFGLELKKTIHNLFIRFGSSSNYAFSFGMGFQFKQFNLDYAYIHPINNSIFEPSHIIGVEISLENLIKLNDKISP